MTNTTTTPTAATAPAMRGYRYKHGDRPLEGYTIQRAAGRGGFGEVYYAVSDGGREVALKVVQTFEEIELRGIGQCMNLKSPHLVTVFDVREANDGQPVVIMEYVAGPSLRDLLDEAPSGLGQQKAAFFLREIGKGLTYLHDCGIVHRDLKPANIFYENGYVKIGDYGLSKAITASHRSGQTMTVGTVHYMAPEVGVGRYDRSIDIYALGALLYEMLTGQPPFFGASAAEVLMKHLGTPVDVGSLSEPFATVIRRAMAKNPDERYGAVQEMVEAVFGAEHVRQSVSSFSPDSLTMVAGKVADRMAGGGGAASPAARPVSSRAFEWDPKECGGMPRWMARAQRARRRWEERVARAKRRWENRIARRTARWNARQPDPLTTTQVATADVADPMPRGLRRFIAGMLAAFVAVVGSICAAGPGVHGDVPAGPPVAMAIFLAIVGGTIGVRLAASRVLPALRGESRFLRHAAAGGLACLGTAAAFPFWGGRVRDLSQLGETFIAIAGALLVLDWDRRTRPDRRERMPIGPLMVAAAAGLVLGLALDAEVAIVIAAVGGIAVVASLMSPWSPSQAMAAARAQDEQRPEPAAPAAVVPPPLLNKETANEGEKESNMAVTRVALGPLKFFASAPVQPPASKPRREGSFVGTVVRFPVLVVATVLLIGAFAAAVFLAADVPGLLATGRLDPHMPQEIERAFNTPSWPNVMRAIGGGVLFVTCTGSSVLYMLARRRRGGLHMARAVGAAALLVIAPFLAAGHGEIWSANGLIIDPWSGRQDWWQVFQDAAAHLHVRNVMLAGCCFVAGLLLLLWPTQPTRRKPELATAPAAPTNVG